MEHISEFNEREILTVCELRSQIGAIVSSLDWTFLSSPRTVAMGLVTSVGRVASIFAALDEPEVGSLARDSSSESVESQKELARNCARVMILLIIMARSCEIDLCAAFNRKIARNCAKYPANKCKGKSDKYTAYSGSVTILPMDEPSFAEPWCHCDDTMSWMGLNIEDFRQTMEDFVGEREWHSFHTPYNLVLALAGEMGELCEIFQWKMDDGHIKGLRNWSASAKTHVGEELADCLCYLLRVTSQTDVNLNQSVMQMLCDIKKSEKKEFFSGRQGYKNFLTKF